MGTGAYLSLLVLIINLISGCWYGIFSYYGIRGNIGGQCRILISFLYLTKHTF